MVRILRVTLLSAFASWLSIVVGTSKHGFSVWQLGQLAHDLLRLRFGKLRQRRDVVADPVVVPLGSGARELLLQRSGCLVGDGRFVRAVAVHLRPAGRQGGSF